MDSVIDFFDTITDGNVWLRVFWVIFGAVLVYYALTSDSINRMLS